MDSVVYNIPISMLKEYSGQNLVVRSRDPLEIVGALSIGDPSRVSYVQVLSLRSDLSPLTLWGRSIPVDLVVEDPEADLPLLYDCSTLLTAHPVRVTIPVVAGFAGVAKLAVALNFTVKLEGSQPEPHLCEDLSRTADLYLHQTTVVQPIEFFHSLFMAFYRDVPLTLWAIQEEDPSHVRYITDEGEETLSHRFVGCGLEGEVNSFVKRHKDALIAEKAECCNCEFLGHCSGYFKWPRMEYRCDGVKHLFRILRDAAEELRKDVAAFPSVPGEEGS